MSRDPNPLLGEWRPLKQWGDLELRREGIVIVWWPRAEARAMEMGDIMRDCTGLMTSRFGCSGASNVVLERIELGDRVYESIYGRSNIVLDTADD